MITGLALIVDPTGVRLEVSAESLAARRELGPVAWSVLETVALVSREVDGGWVAVTNARDLARRLGVGKDRAAAALQTLRQAGLVVAHTAATLRLRVSLRVVTRFWSPCPERPTRLTRIRHRNARTPCEYAVVQQYGAMTRPTCSRRCREGLASHCAFEFVPLGLFSAHRCILDARHGELRVLSVSKLGAGQERYYLDSVADGLEDYYSGRGESPGQWACSAAAHLDLAGPVDSDVLRAVLEGRETVSGTPLGQVRRDRVPGFDLTFLGCARGGGAPLTSNSTSTPTTSTS